MSEHLEKAKAALEQARELDPASSVEYHDLLKIAAVQAELAQAEALERIAAKLDHWSGNHGTALRVLT